MLLHAATAGPLRPLVLLSILACWATSQGCGPTLYTMNVMSAERSLEQAREQNARWYAPYEYHFAEAHLIKAREEAASAAYEDAIRFAETAESYSLKAIDITRRKRESSP